MNPSQPSAVQQLRLIVEATDFEAAVSFYRDTLGLSEQAAFEGDGEARVMILHAGIATLELSNPAQMRMINQVEVDGAQGARVRVAFQVSDTLAKTQELVAAGGTLLGAPRVTPWQSLNARLHGPADLELTLFEELEDLEQRMQRPGFTRPPL